VSVRTVTRSVLVAVALLLGGAAWAELPRLPKEIVFPRGGDSPGQVVFRHDSHLDTAKPACVVCHPQRFSILGKSSEEKRPALTHSAMEKGQACGACHGKTAFDFQDCSNCHAK
jgi:c(7)-type cytochrome triheme protein